MSFRSVSPLPKESPLDSCDGKEPLFLGLEYISKLASSSSSVSSPVRQVLTCSMIPEVRELPGWEEIKLSDELLGVGVIALVMVVAVVFLER